jgi:hypothetical protein
MASEDWEDFMCAVVTVFFGMCNWVTLSYFVYSYILEVLNKSNYQFKPRL